LEKEKETFKKSMETCQTALDKQRKERDQMWAAINSEKYTNFINSEDES